MIGKKKKRVSIMLVGIRFVGGERGGDSSFLAEEEKKGGQEERKKKKNTQHLFCRTTRGKKKERIDP